MDGRRSGIVQTENTVRQTKYCRIRGMVVVEGGRSTGVLLYPKTTFHATVTKTYTTRYAKQCLLASGHSSSARILTIDVTPSLNRFRHFRFYCSNFAVKYLHIFADILVITYS